ncbi:hypothetical protein ACFE04_002003 [Oxalis oulophora]
MSHGDDNIRETHNKTQRQIVDFSSSSSSTRAKADNFGRSVARVAVAQICESSGFDGFKGAALEALVDVAIRYLCDLGKAGSFNANLAGRTQCNLFDIVRGLEDLGALQGFVGAFDVGKCLVGSATLTEIKQFVDSSEDIPFAQPVPSFPIVRDRKRIPSFLHMEETPPGKHIPAWLPALPDPHTYIQTPMWNERATDPRADKIEQARQRRKAERALLSLQQRLLLSNGSSADDSRMTGVDTGSHEFQAGTSNNNPFLIAPLEPREKAVSEISKPAMFSDLDIEEKNVSVLQAFAPAIEAVKSGFHEDVDVEERFLPEKRPAVHFKVRTSKKVLGESLDLSLQSKYGGRKAISIGRDDEKDDRKRRAEYILRQSNYSQDLT